MFKITKPFASSSAVLQLMNSPWPPIVGVEREFKEKTQRGFAISLQDAIDGASADDLHEFLKESLHF